VRRGSVPNSLEQDLRGHVGRAAAVADELDSLVEVGLALRDSLGERKRVTGLHEHVETPALDLAALVVFALEDRQLVHPGKVRPSTDEPCPKTLDHTHEAKTRMAPWPSLPEAAAKCRARVVPVWSLGGFRTGASGMLRAVSERETRVAENQTTFRRLNEDIEGVAEDLGDSLTVRLIPFLCECADARCTEIIRLTLTEYEDLRAGPRRFGVVPGHEIGSEDEQVVSRSERFTTVEKIGEPGRMAAESDPR
jgi:hypothetical protein